MSQTKVGNRPVATPCLVPSISSFETQLSPIDALRLQSFLKEPISLVSALDVQKEPPDFESLCSEYRKEGGILLLDSGGYEHSHIARYVGEDVLSWTNDDFIKICEKRFFDSVFSYDSFLDDLDKGESLSAFETRLVSQVVRQKEILRGIEVIPVIHVQSRDGKKRLETSSIPEFVSRVAIECHPQFVALPERELGNGLLEKSRLVQAITANLARLAPEVSLHILGCGNFLSLAFLAAAGARMFDGLEWYRTLVGENYHLHHFQQMPVLAPPEKQICNPLAELLLSENVPYRTRVAARNLVAGQTFLLELQTALEARTAHLLVDRYFGKMAGASLRDFGQ